MALTDIEAIRLKSSDQPVLHREAATGDGETVGFRMEASPVLTSPGLRVWLNDVLLTETTDYTIDAVNGIITFVSIPASNDDLVFEYTSVVFTDDEVQRFLDDASGSTTLGTALMLMAWATRASVAARKESLTQGGPLGAVTIDSSVRSKELRASAQAYFTQYQTMEGTGYSIDGLTEIAWTEQMGHRIVRNRVIESISG